MRWIIDPIDGTVNYLYGLPDWAVSIAAEQAGEIVAGVVHVPQRGEFFTAVRGGGAFLRLAHGRGRRGHASAARPAFRLPRPWWQPGSATRRRAGQVQGEVVAAVLPRVRDIRRGGSCAVDLCSLAAGRVDAYYERGINYWDRAAGGLIAERGWRPGGRAGWHAGQAPA